MTSLSVSKLKNSHSQTDYENMNFWVCWPIVTSKSSSGCFFSFYIQLIFIPCINKSGETSEHFGRTSRQRNLSIIFVGGPSADWWIWWRWWIYLMICFRTWNSIIDISMNHRQSRHWRWFGQPWHDWLVKHWFNFFPRYINSSPPIIGKVQNSIGSISNLFWTFWIRLLELNVYPWKLYRREI